MSEPADWNNVSRFIHSRKPTQAYHEPLLVLYSCYLGGRAPRPLRVPIPYFVPTPVAADHTPRPATTLIRTFASGHCKIQSP
jgi:hypothetical protein